MTAEERQVVINLRIALSRYTRACAGCGGSGRLRSAPAVHRHCPLCRSARAALDGAESLLMPQLRCDAID
jgi:Zn finger protein HypA/HybF involved in hydrogenase expression